MGGIVKLIVIASVMSACIYSGLIVSYVAEGLATAQTLGKVPFVGPASQRRVEAWVMGAVENDVVDDVSYFPLGDALGSTDVLTETDFSKIECERPFGPPVGGGNLTQGFSPSHNGIDIGVNVGTPVVATQCGRVVRVQQALVGYGYLVVVGNGEWLTYYAHNSRLYVAAGNVVERGSLLASSGSTGNSTGPHVHYEVRFKGQEQDPAAFGALPR